MPRLYLLSYVAGRVRRHKDCLEPVGSSFVVDVCITFVFHGGGGYLHVRSNYMLQRCHDYGSAEKSCRIKCRQHTM